LKITFVALLCAFAGLAHAYEVRLEFTSTVQSGYPNNVPMLEACRMAKAESEANLFAQCQELQGQTYDWDFQISPQFRNSYPFCEVLGTVTCTYYLTPAE
jgi:hypothetical protein